MNLNPVSGNMHDDDKCAHLSDVYCIYEVMWAINDDHYNVNPRFPDSGTRMCKTPCPYLEADGTLRRYPDMPEPEERLEEMRSDI